MGDVTPADRRRGVLGRFLALPRDSTAKTLVVSLLVCAVCSLVVSATAVFLRPYREENARRARQQRILDLLARQPAIEELLGSAEGALVEERLVHLATGELSPLDPSGYDQRAAARDPGRSTAIPPEKDLAGIQRRADLAPVYLVRRGDRVEVVVLPVHGRGYASVIYGYVALSGDGNTILGITFYEHGETPGVGGEIEDPEWRERWRGKRVRGEEGDVRIRVVYEEVGPGAPHRVEGMTGVTRSCDGVSNMVRYWLGDHAFGPFLRRMLP